MFLVEHNRSEEVFAIKCVRKDLVILNDDIECVINERHILSLPKKLPFFADMHSCFHSKVGSCDKCIMTSLFRSICSLLWNLLLEETYCFI